MMNPAAMIKLMNAKKRFEEVHPKFAARLPANSPRILSLQLRQTKQNPAISLATGSATMQQLLTM